MAEKQYLEIIFTSEGIPHGAELTILSNWEETSCELTLRLVFFVKKLNILLFSYILESTELQKPKLAM